MTKPPAASPPSRSKSKQIRGMKTLQNYFTPSPSSSAKMASNEETKTSNASAAVVRAEKRNLQSGNGSSKAPLRLLDDNSDSPRSKKRVKTDKQAQDTPSSMALERIADWEHSPVLLSANDRKDTIILREGATLGRNISTGRRSSPGLKRIDLSILPTATGVSRKHIKIITITPDAVTILQDANVKNSVGIYRYDASSKKMDPKVQFLAPAESCTLVPGDVIEFDNYNRGPDRLTKPEHVFRLVKVVDDAITITSDSECKSVRSLMKKKKQSSLAEPMEVDTDGPPATTSKNSQEEVFVDCVSTPEESFHTARTSQSSTITGDSAPFSNGLNVNQMIISKEASVMARKGTREAFEETSSPKAAADVQSGTQDSGTADSNTTVDYSQTKKPLASPQSQILEKDGRSPTKNISVSAVGTRSNKDSTDKQQEDSAVSGDMEEDTGRNMPGPRRAAFRKAGEKKIDASKAGRADIDMANNNSEANTTSSTVAANSAGTPVVRVPRAGDRFRMVYDRSEEVPDNFLGFARPSWYFGTAKQVKRKGKGKRRDLETYSIAIRFDDGSTDTVEYPSPDVQILTLEGDEAYVEMQGGEPVVAYEGSLSDLAIGDLVDCRYQAGSENGAWFRGRVASLDTAAGSCDIIYYDKEYEQNIPILRTNLCRLEKGGANLTWLESLKVPGGRIVKFGEIDNGTISNRPLVLKVKLSGGGIETKTYAEILPVIFKQALKSTPKTKIRLWPEPPAKPEAPLEERTDPLMRRRERRAKQMDERYGDMDIYDCSHAAVPNEVQNETTEVITLPPSNEIASSICTTLFGAIRSTQPHVGIEFLAPSLLSFNSIPSPALTRQLYEMVVFGPKHDGTFYPDPHKSELVSRHLTEAINRNQQLRENITKIAMSEWQNMEDVIVQVTQMIYRHEGDGGSSCNESLSRIANSLQVTANGLNLLLVLIEAQLRPFITEADGTGDLRDLSVVQALRDCDGGVREALKFVVRMNAQALITFGHFIVGDVSKLYAHEPIPSQANVISCEKELRRVLDAFGRLISYVSWVYAAEEGTSMDTKKFASVTVDVLNAEISHSKVDVDPFATKKDKMKKAALNKYWELVKLEFCLRLVQNDEDFAETLQIKVAEVLGLRKKYSHLFDY